MIFESHAHYDDEAFDEDRETLLASMQENGIEYIINVGAIWRPREGALPWRSAIRSSMRLWAFTRTVWES